MGWASELEHDERAAFAAIKKEADAKRNQFQSVANRLRAKADAAAEASASKAKHLNQTVAKLDAFAKEAKARAELATVPDINGDCTGPKICQLGCGCHQK